MYSASNKLANAMRYNLQKGSPRRGSKRKSKDKKRFYFTDQEFYRNTYLKSDHWKELRGRKLLESPVCEKCGKSDELDVYHLRYRELYNVCLWDLQTLCRGCHIKEHEKIDKKKKRKRSRGQNKQIKKYEKELEENRVNNLIRKKIQDLFKGM